MNIICNNCGGADVYNFKRMEFSNPFIWSLMFPDDIIKFINDYDKLNFNNYEPILLDEKYSAVNNYDRFNPTISGILIDKTVKVYYTHYLYGSQNIPTTIGPDVFYNKNIEYMYSKFETRLNRMLSLNETPSFLVICYKRHGWTMEKIEKLLNTDFKYKTVVITKEKIEKHKNNLTLINNEKLESIYKLPIQAIKLNQNEIFNGLGI